MRFAQSRLSASFALLLGLTFTVSAGAQQVGGVYAEETIPPSAQAMGGGRSFLGRRGLLGQSARRPLRFRGANSPEDAGTTFGGYEGTAAATEEGRRGAWRRRFWSRSLAIMQRIRPGGQDDQGAGAGETTLWQRRLPANARGVENTEQSSSVSIEMGVPGDAAVGSGVGPTLIPPTPPADLEEEVPGFNVQIDVPTEEQTRSRPRSVLRLRERN